jgi:hypothetical protein
MDSTRPIPFHVAAAYGVKPLRPQTQSATQPSTQRVGASIRPPVEGASPAKALVSGRVQSPVSRGQGFDAAATSITRSPSGALQMYSRAADRVEVATAAHLGRMLDTRA